jgi:hypothetical protein
VRTEEVFCLGSSGEMAPTALLPDPAQPDGECCYGHQFTSVSLSAFHGSSLAMFTLDALLASKEPETKHHLGTPT